MRTIQDLMVLIKKCENKKFKEHCAYINSLNLTYRELKSIPKITLVKYIPIKYSELKSLIARVPKHMNGYFEITSITKTKVIDFGFMIISDNKINEKARNEASKPPSSYFPETYRCGIRDNTGLKL